MTVSRREFVARGVGGLAALPILANLAACATAMVHSVSPAPDGRVRIALRDLPELVETGGVATVHIDGEEAPIFVVRSGEREYVALSSVCTHRGCTVEPSANGFACPCHGSRYGRGGEVVRGPAPRDLRRLSATMFGDALEITLRTAGPA